MTDSKIQIISAPWQSPRPCFRTEFPLDLPPSAAFVYRSANNMALLSAGSCVFTPPAFDGEYPSEDVIVVGDEKSGTYILAGALTARRSLSYFTLIKHGRFHSIEVKQPEIAPDGTPEELICLEGNDWRKLLIEYAERSAEAMGVRPFSAETNLVGYCSWYYYYANVTEADVLENLSALVKSENRRRFPVDYFQIDDGYQAFQGDWLERRASWPSPLAETAAKIQAQGIRPGIWVMPFIASTASRTFREHPEWFVKNPAGEPLIFNGWSPPPDNHWACLDATQPEVREHMQMIFRTLYGYGFRFFKMDGLGFALPEGVRSDPEATAVSAFRAGLTAIHEAVPEATLLGCGAPFMPCLGLVDNCRISNDTGRSWHLSRPVNNADPNLSDPCIANALHAVRANWWMLDRWFRADPDAIMVRQDNIFITEGEARISLLTAILTGISVTSDNLRTIAPERLKLLGKSVSLRLFEPVPESWACDTWCQVFKGRCNGKSGVIIFNDSAEPCSFDLTELGFAEGVAEELLQERRICRVLQVPPHDGALLCEV